MSLKWNLLLMTFKDTDKLMKRQMYIVDIENGNGIIFDFYFWSLLKIEANLKHTVFWIPAIMSGLSLKINVFKKNFLFVPMLLV